MLVVCRIIYLLVPSRNVEQTVPEEANGVDTMSNNLAADLKKIQIPETSELVVYDGGKSMYVY